MGNPYIAPGSTGNPANYAVPAYLQQYMPTVPDFNRHEFSKGGSGQEAWQQQHQMDFAKPIAYALAKGDYGGAWAVANQNPYAFQYLTNPSYLQQLNGGKAFTPQQTKAFYTAAMPFAQSLAASGGTGVASDANHPYNFNSGGNQFDSGNKIYSQLQGLANGSMNWGSQPDVGRIAGKSWDDSFLGKNMPYLMAAAAAAMTAGAGAAAGLGPVAAGAVGGAASSATQSSVNGTPITLGSIGRGAASGALTAGVGQGLSGVTNGLTNAGVNPILAKGATGALAGGLTGGGRALIGGKPILSGVGQGALQGGASGLIQGAVGSTYGKQLGNNIFGNSPAGNLLSGAGTGALTGAIGGAISGRGAGSGAVSGAVGGAVQGVGTPSTPSNPSVPTNVNPTPSGSPSMSYDPSFDPNSSPYMGGPTDTTGSGVGPLQDTSGGGGGSAGGGYPLDPGQNPGYTNLPVQGGGGTLSGGYGGSGFWGNAGGALSGLLGGNRGGQAGNGMGGMLGSIIGGLAGPAAQYFGSNMQNNQNRAAAGQFAGQAKFNPYGVSTQGGSASFKNGQATGTMSAGNQGLYNGLLQNAGANLGAMNNAGNAGVGGYRGINQGLYDANGNATSAGHNMPQQNVNGGDYGGLMGQQASMAGGLNGLAGGMAGGLTSSAQQNDFNNTFKNLQDMDRQGNNRFMSGNLDDEFAKGTLASTAGQYQTQGALDALNHQTMQNQNQAQNFAMQNAGQRLANFQGVAGQGQNYGNQFLGFGQNQYAQNANQSGVQYNRASDAFNRAMGMFSGGNQQANQNMGAYGAALGQDQQGMGQMDANQRSLLGLGGDLGAQQSNANYHAFYPQYSANSNSVNGNFLSGIGNYLGQVSGP